MSLTRYLLTRRALSALVVVFAAGLLSACGSFGGSSSSGGSGLTGRSSDISSALVAATYHNAGTVTISNPVAGTASAQREKANEGGEQAWRAEALLPPRGQLSGTPHDFIIFTGSSTVAANKGFSAKWLDSIVRQEALTGRQRVGGRFDGTIDCSAGCVINGERSETSSNFDFDTLGATLTSFVLTVSGARVTLVSDRILRDAGRTRIRGVTQDDSGGLARAVVTVSATETSGGIARLAASARQGYGALVTMTNVALTVTNTRHFRAARSENERNWVLAEAAILTNHMVGAVSATVAVTYFGRFSDRGFPLLSTVTRRNESVPRNGIIALGVYEGDYASFGYWISDVNQFTGTNFSGPNDLANVFHYGVSTPTVFNAASKTGNASYVGFVRGSFNHGGTLHAVDGRASLFLDFRSSSQASRLRGDFEMTAYVRNNNVNSATAAGAVTLGFTGVDVADGVVVFGADGSVFKPAGDGNGVFSNFDGDDDNPAQARIEGGFYGPEGDQASGVFIASDGLLPTSGRLVGGFLTGKKE